MLTRFNERMDYQMLVEKTLVLLEDKILAKEKFVDTLAYLCITFQGLTLVELFELAKISEADWKLMLVFFKNYFNCYKGLVWSVSNDTLKSCVVNRYLSGKNSEGRSLLHVYHLNLGNQMNKTSNSIRKLEEQTINYFFAQEYHLLKQTIADIENFLIMFNPYTKYDLCRYWQHLEGQGYDPVIEYNKRLELFDLHFEPKPEDLFITILQISRFFKEFADFETKNTPAFRHPHIRDKLMQVTELAQKQSEAGDIFAFLSETGLVADCDQMTSEEFPPGSPGWVFRQPDQEEGWENLEALPADPTKNNAEKVVSFLTEIGLQEEVDRMQMVDACKRRKGEPQPADEIRLEDANSSSKKARKPAHAEASHPISALKGHELLNPEIPHQKVELRYRDRLLQTLRRSRRTDQEEEESGSRDERRPNG